MFRLVLDVPLQLGPQVRVVAGLESQVFSKFRVGRRVARRVSVSFVCHLNDTRTLDRLEVVLQQLARLRILVLDSQLNCLRDDEDGS